jgi:hypothetical protein
MKTHIQTSHRAAIPSRSNRIQSKQTKNTMRPTTPILLALALTLTACSVGNKPLGVVPTADSVKGLNLTVVAPDLAESAQAEVAERIAKNLSSWGYPVSAGKEEARATHALEGRVGVITHKSTPPGLSFSFGNADPRSLEFQKADVVPITCAMTSRSNPKDAVTLTGDFAVDPGFASLMGRRPAPASMDYYVDRIGTVCLNLLLELKVETEKSKAATGEPSWIPQVRIEVRDKPDAAPHPSAVPAVATPKAAEKEAQASTVRTETATKETDRRKQLIIHNQGVPVILEFGYERK